MNKDQWMKCNDIQEMLSTLWKNYPEDILIPLLHRFFLKCARKIEILMPQRESLRGVEIGEKFLKGEVSIQCLSDENWAVEGAAFMIDQNTEPELIDHWIKDLESLPSEVIDNVLNQVNFSDLNTRKILLDAAYFADHAMIYPTCSHLKIVRESHIKFLHPDLLREVIGDPNSKHKTPNE